MKEAFPEYFLPTEDEFKQLWKECIFCFDTNVLLNVYRYSDKARERLFEILEEFKDRIWIPHQVAQEYLKRREDIILEQYICIEKIIKTIEDNQKNLIAALNELKEPSKKYSRCHSITNFIDKDKIIEIYKKLGQECKSILKEGEEQSKANLPNLIAHDEYRETLCELFKGEKLGKPYTKEELDKIYKEGKQRQANKIPPGYKDKDKQQNEFGDIIIWFQIIDYAKTHEKPMIFITDDSKGDWWEKRNGKIQRPRLELTKEIYDEAKVKFYMYQCGSFIDYATKFLSLPEDADIVEEADEIKEEEAIKESESEIEKQNQQAIEELNEILNPINSEQLRLLAQESLGMGLSSPRSVSTLGLLPQEIIPKQLEPTVLRALRQKIAAELQDPTVLGRSLQEIIKQHEEKIAKLSMNMNETGLLGATYKKKLEEMEKLKNFFEPPYL